jgi:1,4-dihydroxy-6-naphthoate synthase
MYANQDTLDYGTAGRQAVAELLRRGHEAGIIPHAVNIEFAP